MTLSLQRQGNSFQLRLRDDGRGIDSAIIETRAKNLGLPLTRIQTPADLLAVICQPGFSSEANVSDISGRGVGMDIVAAQISHLGGKLSLDTMPGMGTTFHLQFPVPHLLVSCLMLQAGDRTFAIPTEDIRTTTLFDSLTVTQVNTSDLIYSRLVYDDDGNTTPALDLLEYWRPRPLARSLPYTAVGVYVRSQDTPHDISQDTSQNTSRGIWLIADELLGQSDLLINPLPNPLVAPDGLMGVSLQTDGRLIPVLEATAIADWLLTTPAEHLNIASVAQAEPSAIEIDDSTQAILIVDDAALIRRRIEASLMAYGYTTHTCADGLEAWTWIQKNPQPTLIITDIEMPGMDGFTLIDRCRQAGIKTPVMVISSRLSEEWFTEAKRLGATDYLTKGFSTLELVNKVKRLLEAAAISR